jgi:hypothetical protein
VRDDLLAHGLTPLTRAHEPVACQLPAAGLGDRPAGWSGMSWKFRRTTAARRGITGVTLESETVPLSPRTRVAARDIPAAEVKEKLD